MKKIITQELIDAVSNYLLQSTLPSNDVQKIVGSLKGLPVLEEEKKTDGKE